MLVYLASLAKLLLNIQNIEYSVYKNVVLPHNLHLNLLFFKIFSLFYIFFLPY